MILPIKITLGSTQPAPRPPLWVHKDDFTIGGIRSCAAELNGCPQVYTLKESSVEMTREWQMNLVAINYGGKPNGMELRHISAILHTGRAFANGTGVNDVDHPRKNWIRREDLDSDELPRLDKVRTCAFSVLTGVVRGEFLVVSCLNGDNPPHLKPGRRHPARAEEADIDDYIYTPFTHPWFFYVANNVRPNGSTMPFSDDGGMYDWIGNGRPVTFLPSVARGEVLYPLERLTRLPDNAPIPPPYLIRS